MTDIKAAAVITAAGSGKRFGEGAQVPKQFFPLGGKPLLAHSVQCFEQSDLVNEIVVVVPSDWVEYTETEIIKTYQLQKVSQVLAGGSERQESVLKGLNALSEQPDIAVVHDGVRPFTTVELIEKVITTATESGAAIAALNCSDTVKKASSNHSIEETMPRENIWFAQTPQAFKYDILRQAMDRASEEGFLGTDESLLLERLGIEVKLVEGSKYNIKITTPEDLEIGELILKQGLHRNKQD